MEHKTVAADYKKKVVNELIELIKQYPIVAAVDMENLPAPQLQAMRSQLKGTVVIRMAKARLIKIAIEQCKGDNRKMKPRGCHDLGLLLSDAAKCLRGRALAP